MSSLPLWGMIVLGIFAGLLALLLLLLFFPVTYRIEIRKEADEFQAKGAAYWLFHLVHASFSVDAAEPKEKVRKEIRLFGIPLLRLREKRKRKRQRKQTERVRQTGRTVHRAAKKRPTVAPGEKKVPDRWVLDPHISVVQPRRPGLGQRLSARWAALWGKSKAFFHRLIRILAGVEDWVSYLRSESFARAFHVIRKDGKGLLRAVLPKKMRGTIILGTEDPATTAYLMGMLSVVYPLFLQGSTIRPDFLEPRFEADVSCKRRFSLIVPLYRGLDLILRKEVRTLLTRFQKKQTQKKHKVVQKRSLSWQTTKKTMHSGVM